MVKFVVLLACVMPAVFAAKTFIRGSNPGAELLRDGARSLMVMEPVGTEYVGCYSDKKDDRVLEDEVMLKAASETLPAMTGDVCRKFCKETTHYATQNGNECWCGSPSSDEINRHGMGVCDEPCSGDDTTACGGYDAFSLFKFDDNEMVNEMDNEMNDTSSGSASTSSGSPCKAVRV